jgi:FkbM family methyltransferase
MSKQLIDFAGASFWATPESTPKLIDPEPMLTHVAAVSPGDVFIDVGAGHGLYALRAAALGAQVYAFEPHQESLSAFVGNLKLNDFRYPPIFRPCALFDGTPYPEDLKREVWGRHYPQPLEWITATTLDHFVWAEEAFRHAKVDWIKLDVEGAELGVLEGGLRTIEKWRPRLLIEDHDAVNPDPRCVVSRYAERIGSSAEIRKLLAKLGYEVQTLPWGSNRRFLVAHPQRA